MTTSFLARSLCLSIVSAALCMGAAAEDITALNGTTYKDVTVSRIEPDGLVLMTDAGIEKLAFSNLSPELRQKYAVKTAAAQQTPGPQLTEDAQKARLRAEIEDMWQSLVCRISSVYPDGVIVERGWWRDRKTGEQTELKQPIFVAGVKNFAEGDAYVGRVYALGTHTFEDSKGSKRTLRAFGTSPWLQTSAAR